MPTIREVAEECGVSTAVVSQALRNQGRMSEETRRRVLQKIRETGYRPLAVKRAQDASLTLGIINSEQIGKSAYETAILTGILIHAGQRNLAVTFFPNHLWRRDLHQSVRLYCDGRCDGMLLIGNTVNEPLVVILRERGFPFVLIGNSGDASLPTVDIDNAQASNQAMTYLRTLGHRRIGFLSGPNAEGSAAQRYEGYRMALEEQELALNPAWVSDTGNVWDQRAKMKAGIQKMLRVPRISQRPTALLCWNDILALLALETAQEMGLRVPEDLSVIGFDDAPEAAAAAPPLTTLRQPYADLGKQAVEVLLTRIADGSGAAPRILLPAELIVRGSTGPTPGF